MNYEYPTISQPTASIEDWFTTETYRSPFGYINDPYAGKRFDYLYQSDPIDNPVGSYNYIPSAKGDYVYLSTGLDETTGYQKVGPYTPKINYGAGIQKVMADSQMWNAAQQEYSDRFGNYMAELENSIGSPLTNFELMTSPKDNKNRGGYLFKTTALDGKQYVVEVPHSPGGLFFDWNTSGIPGWKTLGLGDLGGEGNEQIPGGSSASYIPLEQFNGIPGNRSVYLSNVNPAGASGLGSIAKIGLGAAGLALGMPWLGSLGSLTDGFQPTDLLSFANSASGSGLFGDAFGSASGIGDFFGEGTAGAIADWGSSVGGDMGWENLFGLGDYADDAVNFFDDWGVGSTADGGMLGNVYPGSAAWNDAANQLFENAGMPGYDQYGNESSWLNNLYQKAVDDPLGTAAKAYRALQGSGLLSGGMNILGGYLQGQAAGDAADRAANAQIEAARIAADAAKFKPVGVTTRFGKSQFTKDAQGNVVSAGYNVTPDIKAMQDSLIGSAPGMLSQFTGSQAATAPMGDAAQRMMALGNQYLAADPQAQAKLFYDQQQAIMATERARQEAGTLTDEFNRGTYGLATGGTGMMGAANPRMEAMYNAQRQQDLQAAYDATKGGQQYAQFGSGMVGAGGDMLKSMYGTQVASLDPWKAAMGGAQYIEGLGQNALDLSINMGKVASPAESGRLIAQGMTNAANIQQGAATSPWGDILMGGANWMNNMATPQQQNPTYDPSRFRLVPFGS